MNTDSELQIENTLLCYFDRCAAGCGEELLQIISIITDITNNFTSRRMTLNCVQCPRIQALKAAAAGTSLHSVVSSEDGINIYMDAVSDWTLISTSLLFSGLSIQENTHLQEHTDALWDALARVH